MPAGRPPMFNSPEEMQPKIDAYFAQCDIGAKPFTVPGLAYALGFSDRHSLHDYAAKEEFTATIKGALLRIETQRSEKLVAGVGNVTGMIFDLKNNFGWKDKQEMEHSGPDGGPISIKTIERVVVDPKAQD